MKYKMSFTRFAWARKYCKGSSDLYSYVSKDGVIIHTCDNVIKPEDFLEMVISCLRQADVKMSSKNIKKLADYLKVELRNKPLTPVELYTDMTKKSEEIRKEMRSLGEKQNGKPIR